MFGRTLSGVTVIAITSISVERNLAMVQRELHGEIAPATSSRGSYPRRPYARQEFDKIVWRLAELLHNNSLEVVRQNAQAADATMYFPVVAEMFFELLHSEIADLFEGSFNVLLEIYLRKSGGLSRLGAFERLTNELRSGTLIQDTFLGPLLANILDDFFSRA